MRRPVQRALRVVTVGCLALLLGGFVQASSGRVIDPKGDPIAGAQVCYAVAGTDELCVSADEEGSWELPPSRIDTITIRHDGFLPRNIRGGDHAEPIILRPAATILIKLQDADGNPIEKGEADILYSSGRQIGPFPISRAAGTRIRSLEPGPIVILGRSEGFAEGRAAESELRAGKETVAVVKLKRGS